MIVTVFDLISEHAPELADTPHFFFFLILILIIISSDSWRQYKFTIYMPDGHTCPDVEGPLIRSDLKKKKHKKKKNWGGGAKKFVKRTVR